MNEKFNKAMQEKLLKAVIGNAFSHIVGIVHTLNTPVEGSNIFVGSGFCTTINGHLGWLTARHIIDDIREQSRQQNLLGNALMYGQSDVGMFLYTLDKNYFNVSDVVFPDDSLDVAFVSLPDEAIEKIAIAGINQIDMARVEAANHKSNGLYIANGFAARGSKIAKRHLLDYISRGESHRVSQYQLDGVGMQSVLLRTSPEASAIEALSMQPIPGDTTPERTMTPAVPLPDAKGMSGGPVFYHTYQDESLSEFRMFGIQSRQTIVGDSVSSMTFAHAEYAFDLLRKKLPS